MSEQITIYTRAEQSNKYRELEEMRTALLARKGSQPIVIANDEDLARWSEFAAQCKAHADEMEKEKKRLTEGARLTVKRINEAIGPKIDELLRMAAPIVIACTTYMRRKQEAQKAAEDAERRRVAEAEENAQRARDAAAEAVAAGSADVAEKVAEATEAAAVVDDAVQRAVTTIETAGDAKRVEGTLGSKSTLADRWTWQLVDISKVPEEYLKPREVDSARLNKLAAQLKADGDETTVPGIRFINDPVLQQRANKGVR